MKLLKKTSLLFILVLCATTFNTSAQTTNEEADKADAAYVLYEQGINMVKEKNYDAAIKALSQAVTMCNEVTDIEGIDVIKDNAKKAIGESYYAYAMELYQKKEFDNAIEQFKSAQNFAKTNNNEEISEKSQSYIGNVYVSKASTQFDEKNYDATIDAATEAIKIDQKNEMAYFWRGRSYKEKSDLEKMKADLDICMELSKGNEKTEKTYSNAAKIAGNAYYSAGVSSIKAKKFTEAIKNLDIAISYPEINSMAYYYLALSYNSLGKWNEAIAAADKGLKMEMKDPSGTYFELGKAYEGLGKKNEACVAYKKVTSENYKKQAEYQIQVVLKCN